MRELRFRAWDKKRSEMVDFRNCKDGILFCQGMVEVSSGWDSYDSPTFNETEPDRYIIEQYLGLKDKNGKDLDWWEGDVFEIHGRKTLFRITEEGGCYWFRSDITKERFPCYQAIEWAKLPCKLGDSDTIFEDTTPGHKEAE